MTDTEKTGQELLEEAAQHPTLDELMRRDPATLTDDDLRVMVQHQRELRAQFIKNEEKKAAKKAGVEDPDDDDS